MYHKYQTYRGWGGVYKGRRYQRGLGGLNVGRRGYGFWGTLGKIGTKIFKKGGEKLLQLGKKGGEKLLHAGKQKALQLAGTAKKRALDLGKHALEVGKKKAKLIGKQALNLDKQKVKEFGQKAVKEFENKLGQQPVAVAKEIFKPPAAPAKKKRVVLKRPAPAPVLKRPVPAPVLKRPAPVLTKHAPEPIVNAPETAPVPPVVPIARGRRRKYSRRSGKIATRRSTGRTARLSRRTRSRRHIFM